jgi:hypothetical protein
MTFNEFVVSRRVTDSPRGDFVEDTKMLIRMGKMPDIRKWSELEHIMFKRRACAEARREARKLWKEYMRFDTQ